VPDLERTFVMIKPDAFQRRLSGEILGRIERRGFTLRGLKLLRVSPKQANQHYAEHEGKPFFADLVGFMSRGPAFVMVLEGPADTYKVVRAMMGATNSRDAAPGTIRGDLGIELTENLVHGSDSPESAAREIGIFFPNM